MRHPRPHRRRGLQDVPHIAPPDVHEYYAEDPLPWVIKCPFPAPLPTLVLFYPGVSCTSKGTSKQDKNTNDDNTKDFRI